MGPLVAQDRIVVGQDGSVAGCFRCGSLEQQNSVLRLGLPPMSATKLWREGEALHGLWVTNGIRYTQTTLLGGATWGGNHNDGKGSSVPVLLVNIEGENTNSEYAEAMAALVFELAGKPQELELQAGLVWRRKGGTKFLVGALEVPESGVKVARGERLCFAGNIPPSLKGSMTLKIPLEPLPNQAAVDALQDMDFEKELRRTAKTGSATDPSTARVRVAFACEK